MMRYSDFEDSSWKEFSILNEEEEEVFESKIPCVKSYLTRPNPLMDKIEFTTYEPKNHFPTTNVRLPNCLSMNTLQFECNNMNLIEQSSFAHQKMKKDIAKCLLQANPTTPKANYLHLLSLKQYYANQCCLYEKFPNNQKTQYFATFLLSMSSVVKEQLERFNKSTFHIRNAKTPLTTERSNKERVSLSHRPKIDFNSNFESGNLFRVYHKDINEYDLILQNDINTKGNNQWFFFSVKNVPKNTNVKFNIVNLAKKQSLFDYGMKPAVFSMMRQEKRQVGWVREGMKVNYYENEGIKKQSCNEPYYSLSFEYKFIYEGDIVYFSYAIPYTYSNLSNFLSNTLSHKEIHKCVRIKNIGFTLGGHEVDLLQLTNQNKLHHKKIIWILSRQHSGEVTSGFMIEGIINYLLSGTNQHNKNEIASYLLENYVFKIIPMINIDGVVHGNTRAELIGTDPNRKWENPNENYHPIISAIKKLIEKDKNLVEMVLDLHSHSRKLGTFFYGNSSSKDKNISKILPMMVAKHDERFDCRSNRYKGGSNLTARSILNDLLKIPLIYTVEASFYGYQKPNDAKIIPYTSNDYREMASNILQVFAQYSIKNKKNVTPLEQILFQPSSEEDNQLLLQEIDQIDDVSSVGSDEDPEHDQFNLKEMKLILPSLKAQKKKKKQPKKKIQIVLKTQKVKEEVPLQLKMKVKKQDTKSYYRKYFSGKCETNIDDREAIDEKSKIKRIYETRSFGVQAQISEKAILHRTSLNSLAYNFQGKYQNKISQKKHLCIVGQKVEEDLTIFGLNVGVQTDFHKNTFLKNRQELQNSCGSSAPKRTFKSNLKLAQLLQWNENNFLNKGDILKQTGVNFCKR